MKDFHVCNDGMEHASLYGVRNVRVVGTIKRQLRKTCRADGMHEMLDTQLQTEEARKYMLRDAAGGSVGSRAAKAAHNCAITPSFATRAPVINTLYDDFAVVQPR